MLVSIKKTDSYRELSKITKICESKLENYILDTLVSGVLSGDKDECGFTIDELMDEYQDYSTREIAKKLFPKLERNDELISFVGNLLIFGIETYNACKECGCEIVESDDEKWTKYECSNPSCEVTIGERPF